MSNQQSGKKATFSKKWLTRISLAILAAFFSAGVSLAFSEIGKQPHPQPIPVRQGGEIGQKVFSLKNQDTTISQSPITNSQQLLREGKKLFQAEQFSQAVTVWQQAISAFHASGNKQGEALGLSYLSLAYQQLGQWKEAEKAIVSSLSLIQNSSKNKTDQQILAQALNAQGHLQLALGQEEQALTTWEKAAATYSQVGDTEGQIGSQINQAQALQSLGFYRRARKTLEEIETSLQSQPNSLIKATALLSLGNALQAIGELEKSRQLLQQSLTIAQELGVSQAVSAASFSLANTSRTLAKKAEDLREQSTAKIEIKNALEAYQKTVATSNLPLTKLQAQINQLSLLADTQQIREAQALLSLIKLDELPPSRKLVYLQINLAQTLLKLKSEPEKIVSFANHREAAQILAKAVQEAKNLQDLPAQSYALGNLGRLYELTGQFKEAQNLTQQALSLAQAINASDIGYRWQWQLGRLLKDRGDNDGAIASYTVAVETLHTLRKDLVAINPDNPDVQFSFRESVEPVYRELVDLLVTTDKQPSQDNLRQARSVIESLQLAELDNFFREACLNVKPVQIDQVDPTAAVVYPIILKDRLAVILALPQSSLSLYTTQKTQQELESVLNDLQQDIGRPAADNDKVLQLSQQVYNWIIRPIEADIKQKNVQTLVFVPDGLLRNIPMAALHDGEKYLVEKYSIALTPGLQLLPPQPLKREQLRVLTAGLSEARQEFPALPNVKEELEQIQSIMSTQELLNQQFTDRNLQQALNSVPFPVVHIATHGQFSSQAERTFILTWDEEINVKELDNLLRRRKQEDSRPIELLVFSACETAEGDDRAALGLAGVAVRAGARSTVATLWRVSDESTAKLMVRFYQELAKENITKSEALRRAQLSLLQSEQYKIPYYWAPFVLVGSWR
ncbi:CHAT domain-containing protein [Aerosakkonemataceae cyanobacterium BLCC-F50]|uniref:CHAT domain-containing protein n=1 Tax=Floridaenema flaviceps BLCC-F50 TaxID=3153642 RepID=A0ABV4Y2W7_9CYAN